MKRSYLESQYCTETYKTPHGCMHKKIYFDFSGGKKIQIQINYGFSKVICGLNSNGIYEWTWSLQRGVEKHESMLWINCHSPLHGLGSLLGHAWTHCPVNCHDWKTPWANTVNKESLGFICIFFVIGHFLGSVSEENRLHGLSNKAWGKIFKLL